MSALAFKPEPDHDKVIAIIAIIIIAWMIFMITGNSDPLRHGLMEGTRDVIEHLR